MRYQCVHCDEAFEPEAQQDKPRCPKCLRMTGVRALDAGAGGRRARWLWPGVAGAVLLVGGTVVAWMQLQRAPEPEELAGRPLSPNVVEQELQRRGLEAHGYHALLAVDESVERFADGALSSVTGAEDKAAAVLKALQARKTAQAFVRWPLSDARSEAPLKAGEVAAALAEDGARKQLYPLEVAALGVAALRAADVPALIAEVYAYAEERRPLDPSGHLGYFAVALPGERQGSARIFDVYGGRDKQPAPGDYAVLSDLEAVGAALSLHAAGAVARNEEPATALRAAEAAIKLLPTSPSVRSARGAVLLASGGESSGIGEFEAAAQMRPDPARRNNLAMLFLAQGESERATREVSLALEQAPEFAGAHIALASLHLSQGERAQAEQALLKAQSIEPELPGLALAWAQFHASNGDLEQALSRAEEGVRKRPDNPQARMLLARLYRQAARYDDMRREARSLLEATPASQKERVKGLIERLLGPTALEAPQEAASEPSALAPPGELSAPSAGDSRATPGLLDEELEGGAQGGLKLGGDAQKLKLRQPDSRLQLDL